MEVNKIHTGDALIELKKLPDESINCVMTSPPYWALRDYGIDGQLGLEQTFQEYINKLCDIFDEVKRVLRKDGTCWVNLGDTYYTISGGKFLNDNISNKELNIKKGISDANALKGGDELEQKNLCNIPARFSIEMQNRGWILRNVIVWKKPNCMPSSVKDRFTIDFEYIFFFVKNKKYWFETQYENVSSNSDFRPKIGNDVPYAITGNNNLGKGSRGNPELGRNKRTVWTITTQPFSESHFAVFPPELVEIPIKAGCPEFICKKCGKPRESILEPSKEYNKILEDNKKENVNSSEQRKKALEIGNAFGYKTKSCLPDYKFTGYTDCGCNEGFEAGIVLDPFSGSGTTCLVAKKLGRNYIGFELNPKYVEMAEKRVSGYTNFDFKMEKVHTPLTNFIEKNQPKVI